MNNQSNDDFLAKFAPPVRSEFKEQLKAELASIPEQHTNYEEIISKHPNRLTYALRIVAAIVIVIMFSMVALPQGRSIAQTMIERIADRLIVTVSERTPRDYTTSPTAFVTLEEAQSYVSFYVPDNIPQAYGDIPDLVMLLDAETDNPWVIVEWWHGEQGAVEKITLSAMQSRDPQNMGITDTDVLAIELGPNNQAHEITLVNGVIALAYQGVWRADTNTYINDGTRTLSWHMDGLLYTLRSSNLTGQALIDIANSVMPE